MASFMSLLSACAGVSMYNQIPAPVGQGGAGAQQPYTSSVDVEGGSQTYPITQNNEASEYGTLDDANGPASANVAVLALLDSARQARQQGRLDVAASTLERAVRIEPRNPTVWHELAWVRFQQKQTQLAISLAEKSNLLAENNTPLQVRNWLLMSECEVALGNPAGAARAREQASHLQ